MELERELFAFHVGFVVGFADGHELFGASAGALETFDHALGADGVVAAEDGLAVLDAGDDGLDDPAAESIVYKCNTFFRTMSKRPNCRKSLA